jgi:hypothetical protein
VVLSGLNQSSGDKVITLALEHFFEESDSFDYFFVKDGVGRVALLVEGGEEMEDALARALTLPHFTLDDFTLVVSASVYDPSRLVKLLQVSVFAGGLPRTGPLVPVSFGGITLPADDEHQLHLLRQALDATTFFDRPPPACL